MADDCRTPLVVVAGGTTAAAAEGAEQVIAHIRAARPGTAVLHHDLRDVSRGVVRRRLRRPGADVTTTLEPAQRWVSCTLCEDVLPRLLDLGRDGTVPWIVLHLDPALEPEQVCWALRHVLVDGTTVLDVVDLRGVVTVLDVGYWLGDANDDVAPAERGLAPLPDDERTIAQLVVGQAEFADLIVQTGGTDPWAAARTAAVLARLAPLAPRLHLADLDDRLLLADLPRSARRGRPDSPHAALLRGQPPLHAEAGVQITTFTARRPFHPDRLHAAIDVLLDGVVRTRGRVWLATRTEACLWLESAGGGVQVRHVGHWLAADPHEWDHADPERRAAASLRWHPRWGDRAQELAVLVDGADPDRIAAALRTALLTDAELAAGEQAWRGYPDPFGWWHSDPCGEITATPARHHHQEDEG